MGTPNPGRVVTFYSYKGGTGRSMALANTACILAQQGKRVLAVDWDLEAPGLHRYFQEIRSGKSSASSNDDKKLGLIDLFVALDSRVGAREDTAPPQKEVDAEEVLSDTEWDSYISPTDLPNLSFMKAGKFDDDYARRVTTFQWEALYKRSPWLIPKLAELVASRFDFVLVDSRTGLTDSSGICTMVMPDTLVVVFTPNQQSTFGAIDLIERAAKYRRQSNDLRPLLVFPLASRVEPAEPVMREDWRFGNPTRSIEGYQNLFEELFKRIYELRDCSLKEYFDDVQIQHVPRYAYGEAVAVLHERTDDRLSLNRAYRNFVERLASGAPPWRGPASIETVLIQKQQAEQKVAELHSTVSTAQKSSYRKGIFVTIGAASAILLVIAAIAIPNLLRARMAANEASAAASLRTILTAQVAYSATYENRGFACKLQQLALPGNSSTQVSEEAAGLIDSTLAAGEKSGYRFAISDCAPPAPGKPVERFEVTADPVQPGTSGKRSFCSDESAVLRLKPAQGPCSAGAPLVP
jgi:Mrp family chromosome partitioning ATPase/type II secretory pathway pseudopilin PulG